MKGGRRTRCLSGSALAKLPLDGEPAFGSPCSFRGRLSRHGGARLSQCRKQGMSLCKCVRCSAKAPAL